MAGHKFSNVFNDVYSDNVTMTDHLFAVNASLFMPGQITGDVSTVNTALYTQRCNLHAFTVGNNAWSGCASWEADAFSYESTSSFYSIRNFTRNSIVTSVTGSIYGSNIQYVVNFNVAANANITYVLYVTTYLSYSEVN